MGFTALEKSALREMIRPSDVIIHCVHTQCQKLSAQCCCKSMHDHIPIYCLDLRAIKMDPSLSQSTMCSSRAQGESNQ